MSAVNPPAMFPPEEDVADAVARVASLKSAAVEWLRAGERENHKYVSRALEAGSTSSDGAPNNEECDQIEREILPALKDIAADLRKLQHGREGSDGYAKLTPADAEEIMRKVDEGVDQIDSDIDGLGSVRPG